MIEAAVAASAATVAVRFALRERLVQAIKNAARGSVIEGYRYTTVRVPRRAHLYRTNRTEKTTLPMPWIYTGNGTSVPIWCVPHTVRVPVQTGWSGAKRLLPRRATVHLDNPVANGRVDTEPLRGTAHVLRCADGTDHVGASDRVVDAAVRCKYPVWLPAVSVGVVTAITVTVALA